MTDLETFSILMSKIKANPQREENEDGSISLNLENDRKNISGYMGFVASFNFDKEGNLKSVGIFE